MTSEEHNFLQKSTQLWWLLIQGTRIRELYMISWVSNSVSWSLDSPHTHEQTWPHLHPLQSKAPGSAPWATGVAAEPLPDTSGTRRWHSQRDREENPLSGCSIALFQAMQARPEHRETLLHPGMESQQETSWHRFVGAQSGQDVGGTGTTPSLEGRWGKEEKPQERHSVLNCAPSPTLPFWGHSACLSKGTPRSCWLSCPQAARAAWPEFSSCPSSLWSPAHVLQPTDGTCPMQVTLCWHHSAGDQQCHGHNWSHPHIQAKKPSILCFVFSHR